MSDQISIVAHHINKIKNTVKEIQLRLNRNKDKLDTHSVSVIQAAFKDSFDVIEERGSKIRRRVNKITNQRNKLISKLSQHE